MIYNSDYTKAIHSRCKYFNYLNINYKQCTLKMFWFILFKFLLNKFNFQNECIKELDPQYGKLGIQLVLLGNLWNTAQNHLCELNQKVYGSMEFTYSASIQNYVQDILDEWDHLSNTLQLPSASSEFISTTIPMTENVSFIYLFRFSYKVGGTCKDERIFIANFSNNGYYMFLKGQIWFDVQTRLKNVYVCCRYSFTVTVFQEIFGGSILILQIIEQRMLNYIRYNSIREFLNVIWL